MLLHRNKAVFKSDKKKSTISTLSGEQDGLDNLWCSSALDYMPPEDFIKLLTGRDEGTKMSTLSALATQLKGLRVLLSLHSYFAANSPPLNILDHIMQTASHILSSQDTFLVLRDNNARFAFSKSRLDKFNGITLDLSSGRVFSV